MQLITFPITLHESFMITPKVKHFIFKASLTPAFKFLPGQFITIHFEHAGKQLKRSYSIANAPKEDNYIEFAAGHVTDGPGTELLFNLKPGDTININGPFGRLVLKDADPKRYILISTSTGVTPYRAMLEELARRIQQQPTLEVIILLGVQRKEEILYSKEFTEFTQQFKQVTFRPCLSKQHQDEVQGNEFSGYVQQLLPEFAPNPEQDLVYLCGNPGMIDETFDYLKERGFAIQHIIREKYISR